MKQNRHNLSYKFFIVFLIFAAVILLLTGIATYISQINSYRKDSIAKIRDIGEYLLFLVEEEGDDFIHYQSYFLEHFSEIDIPSDFKEYHTAQNSFEAMFAKQYPGKVYGTDILFDDMDDNLKKAFLIYKQEYWVLAFEKACSTFQIPYAYYIVPNEENYHVIYMIDCGRMEKNTNGNAAESEGEEGVPGTGFLYLGDEYPNEPETHVAEWKTWEAGMPLDTYQEWNNAWGHTYSYFMPVIINGQKLGLIGTEVDVKTLNQRIIKETAFHMGITFLILFLSIMFLTRYMNIHYVSNARKISELLKRYEKEKDPALIEALETEFTSKDEISLLAQDTAAMIKEMESYTSTMIQTTEELTRRKLLTEADEQEKTLIYPKQ